MFVKNVRFIDNKVEIILEDSSFFMSKENYIENPIAIDSLLSREQIDSLMEYENVIKSKERMVKLLNRKALSEYEVYRKLKEDNLEMGYINFIIDSLKRIGLINDEYTALLSLEKALLKRKGKLEIVKILKEKKINDKIIDKVLKSIDEEEYRNNFIKVCQKYEKAYSNRSYRIRENMILSKLKEYGYEESLISEIKFEKKENEEIELARLQLNKILKSKDIKEFDYQNINKIKAKLAMKGFSYDIINCVLEEVIKS